MRKPKLDVRGTRKPKTVKGIRLSAIQHTDLLSLTEAYVREVMVIVNGPQQAGNPQLPTVDINAKSCGGDGAYADGTLCKRCNGNPSNDALCLAEQEQRNKVRAADVAKIPSPAPLGADKPKMVSDLLK